MASKVKRKEERIDRIERALKTLIWWLMQTQPVILREDEVKSLTKIIDGD